MKSPYPFNVEFSKVFINGMMKGLTIVETVGFCTFNDARFFAKRDGSIVAPCAGPSDYRQENSRIIENYEITLAR